MTGDTGVVERLDACLRRLSRHVDLGKTALTGSMAIELHLAAFGLPRGCRHAEDLDFVACGRSVVSPTVSADFLVSHFHVPHPGYSKFLVQLVDPDSRVRVDIFPGPKEVIERARSCAVCGVRVRVLEAHALLEHKLEMLARATEERPVDEKHQRDAVLLGQLCGQPMIPLPASRLCKEEYSRDPSARCARCVASIDPAFPLAPKEQILDVLGYV